MTQAVFDKALKCILVRAGLNPHLYSLHSGRRGGATFAFRAGVPVELIRLQGDWRSDAYLLYLKDAPGCAQNRHAEEKRLEREAVERLCQTGKTKGYKHISPKVASALSQYNQFCTNMQRRYNVYRALDTTLLLRAHSTCTRMRSRERSVTPTGDQNWGFENLQNRPTMPIEVQVGYLLVGHTHKDVDQFFSKISSTLQRQDATTVEELIHAFNNSFPNVKTWELEAILDVKAFLGDDFASDEEWKLPINNEVRLVEQLPPPNTKPELVKPRIERLDIEQFEHGVEALWQSGKERNKTNIVSTLRPEQQMRAWTEDRPTPPPQLTQEDRNRIDSLYKSYTKSNKTKQAPLSDIDQRPGTILQGGPRTAQCNNEDRRLHNVDCITRCGDGYGRMKVKTAEGDERVVSLHRVMFLTSDLPILTTSMHVSHLCNHKHLSYEDSVINQQRRTVSLKDGAPATTQDIPTTDMCLLQSCMSWEQETRPFGPEFVNWRIEVFKRLRLPIPPGMVRNTFVTGEKPEMLIRFAVDQKVIKKTPSMDKFTKDKTGHVSFQYKTWSTDTVWRPTATDHM
ncbi:hypothetical protein Bbelb_049630 [Branchiostoma belcheri]|nr:hypothetical protein Bbelb_049630 [Branchiostoma belcheri]